MTDENITELDMHGSVELANLAECAVCKSQAWQAIFSQDSEADGNVRLEVLRCVVCRSEVRPYN
jgi:hypothetical protein|tara:strand:- start:63 stop:254 length:192 start_codon:yes stop_codon:yes gene_type:complete